MTRTSDYSRRAPSSRHSKRAKLPRSGNTRLRVEVVEHLADVCHTWDQLVDCSRFPSPFLRSWWVDGIGAVPPAVLRIPLVFDRDALIGGIPLMHDRMRRTLPRLRSIEGSDYTDIVARPDREAEVLEVLSRWLRKQRTIIDVSSAIPRSLTLGLVPYPRWVLSQTVAPYEDLLGTFDAYMASRSRSWRMTIRRARPRCRATWLEGPLCRSGRHRWGHRTTRAPPCASKGCLSVH